MTDENDYIPPFTESTTSNILNQINAIYQQGATLYQQSIPKMLAEQQARDNAFRRLHERHKLDNEEIARLKLKTIRFEEDLEKERKEKRVLGEEIERLRAVEQDYEQLQRAYHDLSSKFSNLQKQYDDSDAGHQRLERNLSNEVQTLQANLAESNNKIAFLESQLREEAKRTQNTLEEKDRETAKKINEERLRLEKAYKNDLNDVWNQIHKRDQKYQEALQASQEELDKIVAQRNEWFAKCNKLIEEREKYKLDLQMEFQKKTLALAAGLCAKEKNHRQAYAILESPPQRIAEKVLREMDVNSDISIQSSSNPDEVFRRENEAENEQHRRKRSASASRVPDNKMKPNIKFVRQRVAGTSGSNNNGNPPVHMSTYRTSRQQQKK